MTTIPTASTARRVLVAVCHNLGVVDRRACESLIGLGWGTRLATAKAASGVETIDFAWFGKLPRLDALRDQALSQAMAAGFTHVVFLDADMLFPTEVLGQLLRHLPSGAVVSGLYFQRHYPFAPVAYRDSRPHPSGQYRIYRHDDQYADVGADGLRDEELVGMGCALIPLDLIGRLGPRPWFEYRDDADGWPLITEDVPFCEKIRAAGGRIAIDPTIRCGHVYTDVATEAHWQRYVETYTASRAALAPTPIGQALALVEAAAGGAR